VFAPGERVRLLELSDAFLHDLDEEDATDLRSLIGGIWTVDEWHASIKQVEITCWIEETAGSARTHSVWVPPEWVERIR
jgi:hypothetical protein